MNLAPGARISGPAIVREDATSTFVGADFALQVTTGGHLEILRAESEHINQHTSGDSDE